MDNLCHTLAGASLAHAGLKRLTPLATATLLVGANLPDLDALSTLGGGDLSLCVRRGHTHGVLAMVLLPVALAGAMLLVDRWRSRGPDAPRARFAPLLLLSAIGIWSHPALDWLNSYGVRLLMPFSDRWFYGDAVFIVDPWLWLLLGASAAIAWTRLPHRLGVAGWPMLGIATTGAMLALDEVPAPARALWLAGIAGLVVARFRNDSLARLQVLARLCLVLALVYVAAMVVGSRAAARRGEAWLRAQGVVPRQVMAGPLPVNPRVRELIVVLDDRYRFYRVDVLDGAPEPYGPDVPIGGPTPITEAARRAPTMRGLSGWLRFPSYEVEPLSDGYRVTIRDVRFSRFGARARGIGQGTVELDRELRPR